jgi:quercetin 2,3-dioxygenase
MKKLLGVHRSADRHWVGDGFPVRTLLAYPTLGPLIDPFLLLDYAGPHDFPPTKEWLGVGEHPHRGFETVTIVYAGEVEHRDSSGGGGRIGPGDVQWMTAGAGVVHEELHGRDFARRGGRFEMVQLWVNLPAKHKMAPPRYQGISASRIPEVEIPGGGGVARIIAGSYRQEKGPAETFTPMQVWDLRLDCRGPVELPLAEGHTTALVVLRGELRLEGSEPAREAEVALLERSGSGIRILEARNATALLLSGAPIDEPIVGHGPFVMNRPDQIQQAISDYQGGRMGHLC